VIILAAVAYFVVMLTSSKVIALERTRVRAFIPLFIANAVFWSLFQQIFTVLAVYSDEPTTPRKFAYGVIGMGLAFLLFLPMSGTTGKAVPALLVVGIMAVFAASELLLSPIGLFSDDKACA
jgi:proton-dependent oligopeptide transporter, POT family